MGVSKDEDPRPIIIDTINKAYADLGGRMMLFDLNPGGLLSSTMGACGITTWEKLCESTSRRRTLNQFATTIENRLPEIWPEQDPPHPFIPLLETMACYAAKCVAQHITYPTIGETKVGINDFWLLGCKDFQTIWDRTIIATQTSFSMEERDDLYFHFEEEGAVGIRENKAP